VVLRIETTLFEKHIGKTKRQAIEKGTYEVPALLIRNTSRNMSPLTCRTHVPLQFFRICFLRKHICLCYTVKIMSRLLGMCVLAKNHLCFSKSLVAILKKIPGMFTSRRATYVPDSYTSLLFRSIFMVTECESFFYPI
jgi:hypothetical protein